MAGSIFIDRWQTSRRISNTNEIGLPRMTVQLCGALIRNYFDVWSQSIIQRRPLMRANAASCLDQGHSISSALFAIIVARIWCINHNPLARVHFANATRCPLNYGRVIKMRVDCFIRSSNATLEQELTYIPMVTDIQLVPTRFSALHHLLFATIRSSWITELVASDDISGNDTTPNGISCIAGITDTRAANGRLWCFRADFEDRIVFSNYSRHLNRIYFIVGVSWTNVSSSDLEEPNHRSNTMGVYGHLQILSEAEYFFATKNNTFLWKHI